MVLFGGFRVITYCSKGCFEISESGARLSPDRAYRVQVSWFIRFVPWAYDVGIKVYQGLGAKGLVLVGMRC